MTAVACLWIPHMVGELGAQRVGGRPVIVHRAGAVLDGDREAARRGVAAGQDLAGALARCPGARTVPDEALDHVALWEEVLEALTRFSPTVEDAGIGRAYLEAGGIEGLHGGRSAWCDEVQSEADELSGLRGRLGLAGTKFAAWMAARSCAGEGRRRIVEGPDGAFLAPLPVQLLPLEREALRRLRLLGIDTMGGYAALSPTMVAEQLGPEALRAHRLARGEDRRSLVPWRRREVTVSCAFDYLETRREAAVAALMAEAAGALERLSRRRCAVKELVLAVQTEEGDWHRRTAVGDVLGPVGLANLVERLLVEMAGAMDAAGIRALRVRLVGLERAEGGQMRLFEANQSRRRVEEALGALLRKHAPGRVRQPVALDWELPLPEERYLLEAVAV